MPNKKPQGCALWETMPYPTSAQAAFAQHQANAILYEGRPFVVSAHQSAQETLRSSEMKDAQDASLALQAEQRKFANTELDSQRSWLMQEQAFRQEYQNEHEADRKSM